MGFSAAGVPFLGLGLAFLKGLFLCPLVGRGQNEEPSLVRGWGVAGGCSLSYAPSTHTPRLFFNLFFPQGSMTVRRGAEREREQFGTGLDFQSNFYNTLFISLPLEKRSGFWQNSMSGSRRNIT